jgi:hypothetical protein
MVRFYFKSGRSHKIIRDAKSAPQKATYAKPKEPKRAGRALPLQRLGGLACQFGFNLFVFVFAHAF